MEVFLGLLRNKKRPPSSPCVGYKKDIRDHNNSGPCVTVKIAMKYVASLFLHGVKFPSSLDTSPYKPNSQSSPFSDDL